MADIVIIIHVEETKLQWFKEVTLSVLSLCLQRDAENKAQ